MGRLYTAHNLDTHERLGFLSESPHQAARSLVYFLNLSHRDKSATITQTKSGNFLTIVHNGETWTIKND